MPPVALVTGASGFVAHHLIPALTEGGWEVRATGRRPRPEWLDPAVSYQPADLAGDDELGPVVEGADAVFHLAGATSSLSSTEEMHASNVVATTRLAAAARAAGVGRFVHMGSTSIYGEELPLPQPVLETVEPHPSRGYGKAKWQAEQAVWEAAGQGLAAVALRPVSMFGPGAFKLLASAALDVALEARAGRPSIQVDATPIELRLVHVDDVVGAALHLATAPGVTGRAFNLVTPAYPSALEVAAWLAGCYGLAVEETTGGEGGLGLEERRATWQDMVGAGLQPTILFTEQRFRFLKKANRNNRLSVDALQASGYRFRYATRADLATGTTATVEWYRAQHWLV